MRILITAFMAAFLCLPAYGETYVRGMAGTGFDWNYEHNTITYGARNGYVVTGAIGTEIGEAEDFSLALELETTYLRAPIDDLEVDADLNTLGILANGLVRYDPGGKARLRPYVGGGIGLAVNSYQEEGRDRNSVSDPGLAWQAIGGVNIKLSRFVSFDVQYRYMGQDLLSVGDKIENDHFSAPRQHVALAGVTVCFQKCWKYW